MTFLGTAVARAPISSLSEIDCHVPSHVAVAPDVLRLAPSLSPVLLLVSHYDSVNL